MVKTREEWAVLPLDGTIALVVGRRSGKNIKLHKLSLHRDMRMPLVAAAQKTLKRVEESRTRPYEQLAHLEDDEVFLLSTSDLPTKPAPRSRGRSALDDSGSSEGEVASTVITALADPGTIPDIDIHDLQGKAFLFYALVFPDSPAGPLAFLKKHNIARLAKPGWLMGTFSGTVQRLEEPLLLFHEDFDVVMQEDELICLRQEAMVGLFADVALLQAAVPSLVAELAGIPGLALSPEAASALQAACQGRAILARRLAAMIQSDELDSLTPEKVSAYQASLSYQKHSFVVDGQLTCTSANVNEFMDVLGASLHRHGYTGDIYRSDRRSKVRD